MITKTRLASATSNGRAERQISNLVPLVESKSNGMLRMVPRDPTIVCPRDNFLLPLARRKLPSGTVVRNILL